MKGEKNQEDEKQKISVLSCAHDGDKKDVVKGIFPATAIRGFCRVVSKIKVVD